MIINVIGNDLRTQLEHIRQNIKGGRISPLFIEIYKDKLIFIYRNIELPVGLTSKINSQFVCPLTYKMSDYRILYKLIKKFKEEQEYSFDLSEKMMKLKIETTEFSFLVDKVKIQQ